VFRVRAPPAGGIGRDSTWHGPGEQCYRERMHRGEDVRPADSRVKLTYDDFLLFPDDGQRHELIDGEHYVTPSPNRKHQRVLGNLHFLIRGWLEHKRTGEVFMAPFDVVITRFDVVEPDLLYLSNARAEAALTPANVQGVPELVIEIGSPSTRKRDGTIKRRLYEREGVSEYWIVDPDVDVIRVYQRDGGRFARAIELSADAGDTLTTPLLDGLELRLADVFRE
jgi:Uma2 family endonuclease